MLSADQTSSAMTSTQGNYKSWKPKCYACDQSGHFRHDFPKRREHSSSGADCKARTAEEKSSEQTIKEDKSDSETLDTVEAFTASISSAPNQMDK